MTFTLPFEELRVCRHCGATTVEYKHVLSFQLVSGLRKLHLHGRPANIRLLGLTKTEWTNFQKLRYWGLVERTSKGGQWRLTDRGRDFITGKIAVVRTVWTYRGVAVRQGTEFVFEHQVIERNRQREDYVADAEAKESA